MGYSRRIYEIVGRLLTHSGYTSWERIATELGIAKRTIHRDMKAIEGLVAELGMTIVRKTRLGVRLEATEAQRAAFQAQWATCDDRTLSQEERLAYLIGQLLRSSEPQKLFVYASHLGVSEATVSHDMDKLEGWFSARRLELVRRPGLGVYLSGSEISLRKAMVDYLYEHFSHHTLLDLVESATELLPQGQPQSQSQGVAQRALDFGNDVLDPVVFKRVGQVLKQYERALTQRLTENAYTSLAVHLAIAVQRLLCGDRISMAPELLASLREDIQYEIARAIGDSISETFEIAFPEEELGYITMHLKGAKLKTSRMMPASEQVLGNFEMTRLATRMIKAFDQASNLSLFGDEELLVGLVSHLKPALTRMKLQLTIRNPLLAQIKELYPDIFAMTSQVAQVIESAYAVELPESEVGYLAMHFGAAIERRRRREKQAYRLSLALVCASGIGTSSLLASRLTKEFEHIHLVGQFAKQDIEQTDLLNRRRESIDLIITTVPLQTTVAPVVQVNPLLTKADLAAIEAELQRLSQRPAVRLAAKEASANEDRLQGPKRLYHMSEAVLQVAEHFSDKEIRPGSKLLVAVAESLTPLVVSPKALAELFEARERLGATVFSGEGLMLLHTRVEGSQPPLFAVRRLTHPVDMAGREPVTWIVVMVLSKQATPELLALFSWLSQGLLEGDGLLGALRLGNAQDSLDALSHRMQKWLERASLGGGL